MTSRPQFPFDVRSRDVWSIALPASIAFITEPVVGLVDITVVGRLGDAALLGGLVLGALVFDFVFSMAYFLRIGTANRLIELHPRPTENLFGVDLHQRVGALDRRRR